MRSSECGTTVVACRKLELSQLTVERSQDSGLGSSSRDSSARFVLGLGLGRD